MGRREETYGTGHDPGGAKGNGVNFVGGVGIPDDELSVLRSADKVPLVRSPVEGVDFGQMALQCPPHLHRDPGKRLEFRGNSPD